MTSHTFHSTVCKDFTPLLLLNAIFRYVLLNWLTAQCESRLSEIKIAV